MFLGSLRKTQDAFAFFCHSVGDSQALQILATFLCIVYLVHLDMAVLHIASIYHVHEIDTT